MTRGYTIYDLAWPVGSSEFENLAQIFCENVVIGMLVATWAGCDALKMDLLSRIDVSLADEELERSITQLLEPMIRDRLTGSEPYYLQHGPYEFETRREAPAQPPQYDLAFVWVSNPRIMWPIEAKVLRSENSVARYVQAVDDFVTARYAPFVRSAALLGYLFSGSPDLAFRNIDKVLGIRLTQYSNLNKRPHRVSTHSQVSGYVGVMSGQFQCHHLVLEVA